jgi:hypothetical protein
MGDLCQIQSVNSQNRVFQVISTQKDVYVDKAGALGGS